MASFYKVNCHTFISCLSILCRYEFKEAGLNEISLTHLFVEIPQAFCNRSFVLHIYPFSYKTKCIAQKINYPSKSNSSWTIK